MIKRLKGNMRRKRGLKLAGLERQDVIQVHVKATFNNTHLTITDTKGNTIIWGSSGSSGFRGKRKKTPYAARNCLIRLLRQIRARGVRRSELILKGLGKGRRGIGRVLRRFGFILLTLKDNTPIPHNGCRLRKKRRSRSRGQRTRRWREFKIGLHVRRPDLFSGLKRLSAGQKRQRQRKQQRLLERQRQRQRLVQEGIRRTSTTNRNRELNSESNLKSIEE